MTDRAPRATIASRVRSAGAVRLVVALAGSVVLFGPVLLWGLGARAEPIENRPFATRPTLSQGFEMSDQFSAWFTDRLPIRKQAVDVRRTASEDLFGEPPQVTASGGPVGAGGKTGGGTDYLQRANLVFEGRDGWLFYGDDFVRACRPEQDLDASMRQMRRLVAALRSAGKRVAVAIPPDKSAVETEFLPDDFPEQVCSSDAHRDRYAALAELRGSGAVDTLGALQRLKQRSKAPVYSPLDTHPTTRGTAEWVRETVATLDRRAAVTATLVRGPKPETHVGDISAIQGRPREMTEPTLVWQKPGAPAPTAVPVTPVPGIAMTHLGARGTRNAPVVGGRTLWVGDSFTEKGLGAAAAFFRDLWFLPDLAHPQSRADRAKALDVLVAQLRLADSVVLETVERNAFGRLDVSLFNAEVVDRVVGGLAAPRTAP